MNGIANNCTYEVNPTTSPYPYSYPCPELSIQPSVCEKSSSSNRSWLKYLFAATFCILLIAFITFLVLFIVAVSTGGFTKSGRMMPTEDVERVINLKEKLPDFVKHDFKTSDSVLTKILVEKIKKLI